MATDIVINDLIQVKHYCFMNNQLAVNVLHYRATGMTGTPITYETLAPLVSILVGGGYEVVLSNDATYRGSSVARVYPTPGTAPVTSNSGAVAGNAGALELPAQVSGIISFKTGLAGRAQRGRVYIPFPPAAEQDADGTPTAAYVALLDVLKPLLGPTLNFSAGGGTLALTLNIRHTGILSPTPVTELVSKKMWATQRRRGNFGALNVTPI